MKDKVQLLLSFNGQPYKVSMCYEHQPSFLELLNSIPVHAMGRNSDERFEAYLLNRHIKRAIELFSAGKYRYAYKQVLRALDDDDNNLFAYHLLSSIFRNCGQLDEALSCTNKSIAILGDFGATVEYVERAKIYMDMGMDQLGMADLQKAMKFNPYYPCSYNTLAYHHFCHQEYDKALTMVDKYLSLEPECPYGWVLKGQIELALDNLRKALRCANKALKLDEHLSEAYLLKADVYERMGKTKLADKIRSVCG